MNFIHRICVCVSSLYIYIIVDIFPTKNKFVCVIFSFFLFVCECFFIFILYICLSLTHLKHSSFLLPIFIRNTCVFICSNKLLDFLQRQLILNLYLQVGKRQDGAQGSKQYIEMWNLAASAIWNENIILISIVKGRRKCDRDRDGDRKERMKPGKILKEEKYKGGKKTKNDLK